MALAYNMDYTTKAISLNTQTLSDNLCSNNGQAPGCTNYQQIWGRMNYKNGYPGGRIMELSVKYSF